MPKLLASAMPERLLIRARFVLILREPVERTLSWYNHNRCPYEKANGAPWDPCADEKTAKTFEDFIKCREQTHPLVAQGDAGNYGEFVDHILETSVGRKQVLIFNYASAFANATQVQTTMRAITRHYGGQVLDRVFEVPPSNAKEYPAKIAQISCAARNRLAHTYARRACTRRAPLPAHCAHSARRRPHTTHHQRTVRVLLQVLADAGAALPAARRGRRVEERVGPAPRVRAAL